MIATDQYPVVFDLYQKGFQWDFSAYGLIFVAIGRVFLLLRRILNWPLPRPRRFDVYFFIGLSLLWSGTASLSTFREYSVLRSAYRRSQFSVVEGRVTNFRPMPLPRTSGRMLFRTVTNFLLVGLCGHGGIQQFRVTWGTYPRGTSCSHFAYR